MTKVIYDYQYVNKANPFHFVKLSLDGDFVEVGAEDGEEVSDAILKDMVNMYDVDGFSIEDL
ncbi:hypothetical protein VPEG_00049 [Vibrio phage SIO-2]|uniref:hypothetical protein n=1 Tax=Vibrio phage SIO-2 TaxID=700512 RepID=UPI0002357C57|nr:hypothetical protein VPEG_00049 [Vibrio phage SIO-2]AET42200.1 hypothetical protein VPEG_00049 [Vibrio phage SIO-2]